jgi:predicted neuraminidase
VGIIQPTVVRLEEHHLRFYARGHMKAARIAVADSIDDGKTWSQARFIESPNPNSGIDAVRLKLLQVRITADRSWHLNLRHTPFSVKNLRYGF